MLKDSLKPWFGNLKMLAYFLFMKIKYSIKKKTRTVNWVPILHFFFDDLFYLDVCHNTYNVDNGELKKQNEIVTLSEFPWRSFWYCVWNRCHSERCWKQKNSRAEDWGWEIGEALSVLWWRVSFRKGEWVNITRVTVSNFFKSLILKENWCMLSSVTPR